jgi:hypothetical protein
LIRNPFLNFEKKIENSNIIIKSLSLENFLSLLQFFVSVFGGAGFYHPKGIPNRYDGYSIVHQPSLVKVSVSSDSLQVIDFFQK